MKRESEKEKGKKKRIDRVKERIQRKREQWKNEKRGKEIKIGQERYGEKVRKNERKSRSKRKMKVTDTIFLSRIDAWHSSRTMSAA